MEKLEKYDLINEVGLKNQYDKIALDAQLLSEKFNDFTLREEGIQLTKLIQEIPYDSDKFYVVISQIEKVKKLIDKIKEKEASNEYLDDVGSWGNAEIHRCTDGSFLLNFGFIRKSKTKKINMPTEINKLLGERKKESDSWYNGFIDTYYPDNPDDLLVEIKQFDHENSSECGFNISIFNFKSKDEAKEFFEKVKNLQD